MTPSGTSGATLTRLDPATRALVRAAAAVSAAGEEHVRAELQRAASVTPHDWVEELLLQTYLFAGFPRALNAMREWRRLSATPSGTASWASADEARAAGETTCALVYGGMYERLRVNVRALHPLLDDWMVEEGYGKVLSRPALDLPRRELCIVAACAASAQDRQLLSHLHGAVNVGVEPPAVTETLDAIADLVAAPAMTRARGLWDRIRNDVH
jgi:4-carboxymuconolactone decarboxylase